MIAKDVLESVAGYRKEIKPYFSGEDGKANFDGVAPIYLSQKIDALILDLLSLKTRMF